MYKKILTSIVISVLVSVVALIIFWPMAMFLLLFSGIAKLPTDIVTLIFYIALPLFLIVIPGIIINLYRLRLSPLAHKIISVILYLLILGIIRISLSDFMSKWLSVAPK